MEKYLIILVLLATIYYIQNKLKTSEGFADVPAQSLGGVDDTNAINTLAQISKQLMAGGLTVPGDITIKGIFNSTGGSRFTGNRNWFQDEEGKGRLRVGAAWGIPGIYSEDGGNDLVLGSATTMTNIGPPGGNGQHLAVNGNLGVNGNLTFPNATTIVGKQRLHIGGEELLYILNKAGVMVGKEWGGNGNVTIQGNLSVGETHRVQGRGMRIFTMQLGDNAETPVKDPEGNQYKWGEWVCCVQGLRMDWGGRGPGAVTQFCHERDGFWWIRSECEGEGDSGWPIILAIPWGFFDKVWAPPNGPGFLGGW